MPKHSRSGARFKKRTKKKLAAMSDSFVDSSPKRLLIVYQARPPHKNIEGYATPLG